MPFKHPANESAVPTILQLDELEAKGKTGYETFPNIEKAEEIEFAIKQLRKGNPVIYTPIDPEISDDRIYRRGKAIVNRTNVYAVVVFL